jgi:flagellar assembly protein FliH
VERGEQNGAATGARRVVPFEYPACADARSEPAWLGWGLEDGAQPASAGSNVEPGPELRAEFERRLAEESRRAFEAGRERGRQEGRAMEREAQSESENRRRSQAGETAAGFARERDRFLERVEREVVHLALAVAARILRREAQMDPLLLTGAVRVALGQLAATTQVRLCVPKAELDLWTQSIALLPNLPLRPAVVADDGLRLGDCRIETELGSVDLGIRAQLNEIERGFFDRAGAPAQLGAGPDMGAGTASYPAQNTSPAGPA